jgi:arylsulfatase A-like enzyme
VQRIGVCVLALLLCTCSAAPPERAVHVVLISIDTLRADRLNCYGYADRVLSPHIDALARDGILFENHISSSPWTTPAHMSLMTSLHPSAHGVTQSFGSLRADLVKGRPFNRLSALQTTLAEVLQQGRFATAAFTGGVTLDPRIGFDQGFARYDSSMFKLNDRNVGAMFDWIERHGGGRFFLFWHTFEVHTPFLETGFLEEVLPKEKARAISEGLRSIKRYLSRGEGPFSIDHPIGVREMAGVLKRHGAFRREVTEALYCGGVRSVDRWIGRLVQELRFQGLYERTLIVLTSDHGEELGDRSPQRFFHVHGNSLFEEMIRVPLIIKLPDQSHAGSRVNSVTRMVDIMPTILDVVEMRTLPSNMQGASLRPLWESSAADPERIAYAEALVGEREMKGIRTGRYKLVLTMDPQTVREHGRHHIPEEPARRALYDLREDPKERTDLLTGRRDDHSALARSLERALRRHVSAQKAEVEEFLLDDEAARQLEALGYLNLEEQDPVRE